MNIFELSIWDKAFLIQKRYFIPKPLIRVNKINAIDWKLRWFKILITLWMNLYLF